MNSPTIETHRGRAVVPHLDEVAALRIAVFRAFPYLYEGDIGYERAYLEAYADSEDSLFVLARHEGRVVGASTGLPLDHDAESFRLPFEERGLDPASVFYFGESVLLPDHRGLGIGHRFFDEREGHARALGRFRTTAFCAVDRDEGDSRRPRDHRTNDAFWGARGYVRQPGMAMRLGWREVDGPEEVDHSLTFWLRALEDSVR